MGVNTRTNTPVTAGLTGGIATGKSTVAGMFRVLGAAVIDADQVAREVVRPGQEAWEGVVEAFGRDILTPEKEIDRPKLARMVFNDPHLRKRLESILHPRIHQTMDQRRWELVRSQRHGLILMDIPLLFETNQQERFTEIIVVYIPEELQLQRLMQRDNIPPEAARTRLDAQISIEIKRHMATQLIDNSGARAQTRTQVKKIYQQFKLKGVR
jgi:dephospho-CoA kinase